MKKKILISGTLILHISRTLSSNFVAVKIILPNETDNPHVQRDEFN